MVHMSVNTDKLYLKCKIVIKEIILNEKSKTKKLALLGGAGQI